MPVPAGLNYDMWLGSTPRVYYTEKRVHPQGDYSRPGWLRCEQFGAGMITGWGVHHIDIALWGAPGLCSSTLEVEGTASKTTARMASAAQALVSDMRLLTCCGICPAWTST